MALSMPYVHVCVHTYFRKIVHTYVHTNVGICTYICTSESRHLHQGNVYVGMKVGEVRDGVFWADLVIATGCLQTFSIRMHEVHMYTKGLLANCLQFAYKCIRMH